MGNTPLSPSPRVVIVGAGFGGLQAAKALKRARVQLTLIDRSNHHLFQPLLYQVATATLSPADIATPIRSVLRDQENTEVLMAEVHGIDRARRAVQLNDREIPFDYLVLATGARHSYFGHEEWERFAPGLKSIADATRVREKILSAFESAEMEEDPDRRQQWLNFVLVGGGPTGVEMAGAIAELSHRALASDFRRIDPKSTRVILIEAGPRLLGAFAPDLSQHAQSALERLGVDVRTNSRVEKIDGEGVRFGDTFLPSRTVIWTAGVQASPAGQWLGAEMDRAGRVKVLPDLSVPGQPNIFVVGDSALALAEDGTPLPGVAPVAMQQGRYIARLIQNRIRGDKETKPFHYVDKGNLATIGRKSAVCQIGRIHLTGLIAWVAWAVVHIYYLIGFRNRLLVMLDWAYNYFTFQRGARLIVARSLFFLAFLPLRPPV
jgi:NADH dehydrogenase